MKPKKEMDLIVISPCKHLTPTMREALELSDDAEGLTVVHILKNQDKPDLGTLQELVGGYIERVPVYWKKHVFDGWINEEGKLSEPPMEPNLIGTALWLNTYLAQMKRPVFDDFSESPESFVKDAWRLMKTRDYIAGPLIIYSSQFREAIRHAPPGHALQ